VGVTLRMEAEVLARVSGGEDPEDIRKDMDISHSNMHGLMRKKDFEAARERYIEMLQSGVQRQLASRIKPMVEKALQCVEDGLRDDPKLAFAFLKETNALKTMGNRVGMDSDAGMDTGLVINLQTNFGSKEIEFAPMQAARGEGEGDSLQDSGQAHGIRDAEIVVDTGGDDE